MVWVETGLLTVLIDAGKLKRVLAKPPRCSEGLSNSKTYSIVYFGFMFCDSVDESNVNFSGLWISSMSGWGRMKHGGAP